MKKSILIVKLLSLLVLVGCIIYIVHYFVDLQKADDEINYLRELVRSNTETEMISDSENGEQEVLKYADNGMFAKYYPLYEMNHDVTGWIRVRGTNIDYPVMYKNDNNDYYMRRSFNGENMTSGSLFMDYECSFNHSDNLIVYGHNMRAGTMFAELLKYKDKEFYDSNGYILFDSLYKSGTYRVIGVFFSKPNDGFQYYAFTKAQSAEEFNNYVSKVKSVSLYDTGETAKYGDRLLTLSTCSYNVNDERFVVVAKLIYEK